MVFILLCVYVVLNSIFDNSLHILYNSIELKHNIA